jgi:hypothetical protein
MNRESAAERILICAVILCFLVAAIAAALMFGGQ